MLLNLYSWLSCRKSGGGPEQTDNKTKMAVEVNIPYSYETMGKFIFIFNTYLYLEFPYKRVTTFTLGHRGSYDLVDQTSKSLDRALEVKQPVDGSCDW